MSPKAGMFRYVGSNGGGDKLLVATGLWETSLSLTELAGRSEFVSTVNTMEEMIAQLNGAPTEVSEGRELATSFRYVFSNEFSPLLEKLGLSLLLTTYQAGKLMAIRAKGGRLSTLLRTFERPMGLARDGGLLALGTRNAVWLLRNAPDIAPQIEPCNTYDACYVPRHSHITGDILCHEMAWGERRGGGHRAGGYGQGRDLWIVNTRFSCLCTLNADYSFVPRWQPRFISSLVAEDRCHLNGLAMQDGNPKYVTALGMTDSQRGWSENKAKGGVLIDVASSEIVAHGFAMPHSPRVHNGKLWVLDSGRGALEIVDSNSGQRETVVRLPGYARGLTFHDRYAFVGLSKIREKREFGGLPIEEDVEALQCGIWVVDLEHGTSTDFMAFESGCEEVFAVEVLPGIRWPAVLGFQQETINGVFILPDAILKQQMGR